MRRNLEMRKYSIVTDMVDNDISKIEAKHIFDAARAGDKLSISIIDKAVEYLGIGLASVINLIDPERVIICGGIMKSSDLFYEKLKEVIKGHQMKYAGRNVFIVKGKLGDDATAIGAAAFILKEFIDYGGDIAQRNVEPV
jgi:predicted NBD/HSP70 family sugar kinase